MGMALPSQQAPADSAAAEKPGFKAMFRTPDGRSHLTTFILVSTLFWLWGFSNGQLEVLNKHFQNSLSISISQSTFVQFVTFIGYAMMAFPAGMITRKYGYKGGILFGLGLVTTGAFWFIPASYIGSFPAFLAGLFVIACGFACLETVANPYTTVLGPQQGAAARINLAQSCNSLGVMLGPIVGSKILLSTTSEVNKSNADLYLPYVGIGSLALILGLSFFFSKVPEIEEKAVESKSSLWGRPHFSLAVLAQFFYVGGQIAVWALFINYLVAETPGMSAGMAGFLPTDWTFEKGGLFYVADQTAGKLLSVAFALFLIGRVTGSMALRIFSASKTLALYSLMNALMMVLVVLKLGWISVAALFGSFFFMSIMFPTIFSLGIHGLGENTKKASSFIVMAIGGGAVFPFINAQISQTFSMRVGFVVPMICFLVVMVYALSWEGLERRSRT